MSSELQCDASLPAPREMDSADTVNQAVIRQLYSQMMEQSGLCDITVSFGEGHHQESMKAHSCVLVHSPYFQSMYNSGLRERKQGEVHIGIGKPKFVKMALVYLYTGKVAIEYSTIKDLLEVADYLQIDSLKEDCSRYLRDVKLTVANCIPLCLMSSLYNIEYYSDVFNFIRAHLSDVINQQEALKMSPASVTSLVADPTLSYVPREDLFNFLFRWIKFDPENRSKYFEDMYSVLDLSRMSLQFLTDILQRCKYVMSSEKCLKRTFEVVQIIRDGDVDMSDKTDVFVFSGSLNSYKNDRSVYLYAIKSKCWVKLPTLSDAANISDAHCILNCKGDGVFLISKLPEMKNPKGMMEFYKYSFISKRWSRHLVEFEGSFYADIRDGTHIEDVVALQKTNEIGIITNTYISSNNNGESDQAVVHAVFYDSEMTRIVSKTQVFKTINTSTELRLSCCVAEDRYVCVYIYSDEDKPLSNDEYEKFFMLDRHTKRNKKFKEFSEVYLLGHMLNAVGQFVYLKHANNPGFELYAFNVRERKWYILEEIAGHSIEMKPDTCGVGFFEDQCFPFSSNDINQRLGPTSPSSRNQNGSFRFIVRADKIPSRFLPCHVECPHCKLNVDLKDEVVILS